MKLLIFDLGNVFCEVDFDKAASSHAQSTCGVVAAGINRNHNRRAGLIARPFGSHNVNGDAFFTDGSRRNVCQDAARLDWRR